MIRPEVGKRYRTRNKRLCPDAIRAELGKRYRTRFGFEVIVLALSKEEMIGYIRELDKILKWRASGWRYGPKKEDGHDLIECIGESDETR